MDLYRNYIDKLGATAFSISVAKTKNEILPYGDFQQNIASNPDLLFFSATLWQMYILNEKDSWEQLAKNYTKATQKLAPHTELINGEVIQSVFLTPYKLNPEKELLGSIVKSLSQYISGLERKDGFENKEIISENYLDLLLENKVLFFATNETGDPVYRKFALENSSGLYESHFRNDLKILSVLRKDITDDQITRLSNVDFYTLAVGLYGFLTLYEETEMIEYIQFCEKIAFLFDCIYNSDNHSLKKNTKHEVDLRIDLISKSLLSIALFDLSKYSNRPYKEISENIYTSTLSEIDLLTQGRTRLNENQNNKVCSLRMFYYLFEYELKKQNIKYNKN